VVELGDKDYAHALLKKGVDMEGECEELTLCAGSALDIIYQIYMQLMMNNPIL